MKFFSFCALSLLLPLSALRGAGTLDVYVIDVEGGKAMIVVPPGAETMLIDAGYPTKDDRDTNRIVAAAQALGIKEFDYILATHFDGDHAGNIPRLDSRIPGRIFVDHGEILPTANARSRATIYEPYVKAIGARKRMIVKPGDEIPLKGVKITVVCSGGEVLSQPLPGAGQANPLAVDVKPEPIDTDDNAGSVGLLFQFGKFRMLDLADLLQMIECKLMAPRNLVGTVDLFMVSHHGFKVSNSDLLVHSIRPKVAIMNNSSRKGGDPRVLDTLKSSPGLQDLWQLHTSNSGKEKNAPEQFIANPTDPCEAKMIKVSAQLDGTFTVTNTRNNFSRTYQP
jgi:beta-lactamase superfamily II metal-dependent hydrolase